MRLESWALLGAMLISSVTSFPQVTDSDSLVISSTASPKEVSSDSPKDDVPILPKIYEMKIDTNISNRFAHTQISSKVKNLDKSAREATFSVVIPDKAFISGFVMEIDGKSYEAYVQEKEQAKTTYETAVASGQAAAHVAVNARDSNRFTVSVNVEPQSKAVFYLKYEELLPRQNERYELVLNIQPGQPVKKLDVEVHIDESRPLTFVKAPPLRSGNEVAKDNDKLNPNAEINMINKTSAVVKFSPDIEKQKHFASELGTKEENGLAGQFIVQYDVERDPQGGEVLVDGGYFVHFFAPSDLQALPKQVVFILDTSGSMEGIRVTQLKEAMRSILSELKPEDVFNIVEFGTIVKVWNVENTAVQYESGVDSWSYEPADPEALYKNRTAQPLPPAYEASEENIKKAEQVVGKLRAYGGTDIESALKVGLQLVQENLKKDKKHQSIIVFLTDGEPTVGEVDATKIVKTVTELNTGKTPIFSLSFGDGADRSFLQKISIKNLGFARHIYEAADASLQLEEFYKEISSPVLSNVTFKYVSNVSEVTKTEFPILFRGSEIVVAGQIDPGFAPPVVESWGINGPVRLVPVVQNSVTSLERLWALLTLQQILEQRDAAENKTGPTQEALRIALKYSLVSDVSSLVVVKPNATSAVETEDASNDRGYPIIASGKWSSRLGLPLSYPAAPVPISGGFGSFSSQVRPQLFQEPEDLAEDHVYSLNPIAPTSVHSQRPILSTTIPFSTTTFRTSDIPVFTELDIIKTRLPWLSSLLNENGTINLPSGVYKLGLNETLTDKPECPKSPLNATGDCTLITMCPQIYTQLIDLEAYQTYFCDLKGYAGVCCPKLEEKPTTVN